MKAFCFTKQVIEAFLEKRRNGELSLSELNTSSEKRLALFKTFMDETSAKEANLLFEKKMLRKNQMAGLKSWVDTMSGADKAKKERLSERIKQVNEEKKKRLFSPAEDEAFYNELANEKLGVAITREESAIIYDLSRRIEKGDELFNRSRVTKRMEDIIGTLDDETKKNLNGFMDALLAQKTRKSEIQSTSARLKRYLGKGNKVSDEQKQKIVELVDKIVANKGYRAKMGIAKIDLDDFVGVEKLKTLPTFKKIFAENKGDGSIDSKIELGQKLAGHALREGFALAKTAASTLDASFLGRQGRVAFYNAFTRGTLGKLTGDTVGDSRLWAIFYDVAEANYGTLFKNKQFGGKNSLKAVRQRIAGFENSINGYYDKAKLDIGVREEAFPPSVLEYFKKMNPFIASNEAFTASAYTLRALEFDRLIDIAKKNGKEIDDDFLKATGAYVNSLTGRGTGGIGKLGEKTNLVFFSPKFLQSTLDTLTAHQFSSTANSFVKSEARKSLVSIIAGTMGVLMGAKFFGADIEEDPRSSDFGKIRIGDRRFDVTGGLNSVVTLVARLGGSKSTTTGVVTKAGDFGGKDFSGLLADFAENKTSPGARAVISLINNQNFNREPVRDIIMQNPLKGGWIIARDTILPIPVQGALKPFASLVKPITPTGLQEGVDKYIGYSDEDGVLSITGLLADFAGISSNAYSFSYDWSTSTSKDAEKMRSKYDEKTIKKVSKEYSTKVNLEILKLRDKKEFRKLTDKDKLKAIDRKKAEIQKEVFYKNRINLKGIEVPEKVDYSFEEIYSNL